MGETITRTEKKKKKKKKKKGRPSLLELQKRALKQQQQQEKRTSDFKNPNSINLISIPTRRRNPKSDYSARIDDEDDDDVERKQKKHRLWHGLNSRDRPYSPVNSSDLNLQSRGSDLNADEAGEQFEAPIISRLKPGLGSEEMVQKISKATDFLQESLVESGPTTPLPDKKLLVFVLDGLQKKDAYGVFSEPVDPEELPDYQEIISNPMDFSTVRRKLDDGAYANLEQFERDVFLICTNAMEYNAPDTVYFRQARAMQEMAKRDFENLRQDSDDDCKPQPKVVRRGRPPGKSLKNQLDISSMVPVASDFLPDATGGDDSKLCGSYNLRKTPSYRLQPADTSIRDLHSGGNHGNWSTDWENEFPASVVRAVAKYGMKHFTVDENRRDTYNQSSASMHESCVFSTLEDELKQLIPVGLNSEYGYARSLARFAANLGPVPWKMAARKVESVLPPETRFGPGWVAENTFISEDLSNFLQGSEEAKSARRVNSETKFGLPYITNPSSSLSSQIQTESMIDTTRNGLTGGFGEFNQQHQLGIVSQPKPPIKPGNGLGEQFFGDLTASDSTLTKDVPVTPSSQHRLSPYHKLDFHRFPPDLIARFLSVGSPGSNPQMGSSQLPDLALQL